MPDEPNEWFCFAVIDRSISPTSTMKAAACHVTMPEGLVAMSSSGIRLITAGWSLSQELPANHTILLDPHAASSIGKCQSCRAFAAMNFT
jgi:hypothetical protein